jgi:hypothetical protein
VSRLSIRVRMFIDYLEAHFNLYEKSGTCVFVLKHTLSSEAFTELEVDPEDDGDGENSAVAMQAQAKIKLAKARMAQNAMPGDEFRESFLAADVSQVLNRYRQSLERIYLGFASSQSSVKTPWANTLDWNEFMSLLDKAKFTAEDCTWFTADDLRDLNMALAPDNATDEERFGIEMIYPKFLEALLALSAYRYPDPFVSLSQKFEMFLLEVLFPPLRRHVGSLPVEDL